MICECPSPKIFTDENGINYCKNCKQETEIFIKPKVMSKEIENYQKLTKFQRDIVDALKQMGFKWKYFSSYELKNFGDINVSKINKLSDLIFMCFKLGMDQKRFEILNILGIA